MGEAIPLQEVRVLGVCSEKSHGQWAMIDKGQSMTRKSHGGTFLRIATVDIGYGHDGIKYLILCIENSCKAKICIISPLIPAAGASVRRLRQNGSGFDVFVKISAGLFFIPEVRDF